MSRRKRQPTAGAEQAVSRREEASPATTGAPAQRVSRRLLIDIGILVAVFAVTVGIAELAGAANLGVAIGVGQVTFAIVLVALMLRA